MNTIEKISKPIRKSDTRVRTNRISDSRKKLTNTSNIGSIKKMVKQLYFLYLKKLKILVTTKHIRKP